MTFKKQSGWGYISVVDCMLSIHKALDFIPNTRKNEREVWREETRKEEKP